MGDHHSGTSPQPQRLRPTHSLRLTAQHLPKSPNCNKQLSTNKTPSMPLSSSWPEQSVSQETSGDPQATVTFDSTAAAAAPSTVSLELSKIAAASQFAKNIRTLQNSATIQTTRRPLATKSGGRVSAAETSSPTIGSKVTAADQADDHGLVVSGMMPRSARGSQDDDDDVPHSFTSHRHASQTPHFGILALEAWANPPPSSMPPPLLLLPEAPSGQMLSPPPLSVNPRELLRNRSSVGAVASGGARTPATPITPAAMRTPRNAGPDEYDIPDPHILQYGFGPVLGRRVSKPVETESPARPRTKDVLDALRSLVPYSGSGAEVGELQSHDGNNVASHDEAAGSDKGGERGGGVDGGRRDVDGGTNEDETETETETVTITVTETDGEMDTAAACPAGLTGFSQWASSIEAANSSILPTPFGGQWPSGLQPDALRSGVPPTAPTTAAPPPLWAAKQSTEGSTTLRFSDVAADATVLQQRLATQRPPSAHRRTSPTKQKRATSYSQFTTPLLHTSCGVGPAECEALPLEVTRTQAQSEPGGLEASLRHALPPPSFLPAALAMPPPRAQYKQQQRQLQQQQQELAQSPLPQMTQQLNLQQDEREFFPKQWKSQQGQPQAPVHHGVDGAGDKGAGDSARGAHLPPPIHVTVAAARRPWPDTQGGSSWTNKRRAAHSLSVGTGLVNNNDQAGAVAAACTTDTSAPDAVAEPDRAKLDAPQGAGELTAVPGLTPPSSSSHSAAASTTAHVPDFAFVRQRRTVTLAGFTVQLDPGMICEVVGLFHPVQYMAGAPCIECPPGSGLFISRSHFEKIGGSLTAKWYRSLRVIPSLEALGDWLQRQHLPVFKGCPRKSQKAAAAEAAKANTAGAEIAQRREAPRKSAARSAATTPEPSGRTSTKPTGTSSTTPPGISHEEAAATVPEAAPTTVTAHVVVGNQDPEEAASSDPRAGPGAVSRYWNRSQRDLPYRICTPRPPSGALPVPLPPHSWSSAAAAPTRSSTLAGAVPAPSSSTLYDRARMRSNHLIMDLANLDNQNTRGLVLYSVRGPPAWPHQRLTTWPEDPDQQQALRLQTVNVAAKMDGGRRLGRIGEGEERDDAAGMVVEMGGFGGDRIGRASDDKEGRRMVPESVHIATGAGIHGTEDDCMKEMEAGVKISGAETAGRIGSSPYGGRAPPSGRQLYGTAPLTRMSLQELYATANLAVDGETVSFQLVDNARVANEPVLRSYGTASLAVTDKPSTSRHDRISSGSGPGSAAGVAISDRRKSILEGGQPTSLATIGDTPSGSTAYSLFSDNPSLYKRQVPYTYPSPYFLQPRRGVPAFWGTADGGINVQSAGAVAINDERRCSDGSDGSAGGQGATTDVPATHPRRPVLASFPPPPYPLLPPYYYAPHTVGRPAWRSQFPLVRLPVPAPVRPGQPGSSSTLTARQAGLHPIPTLSPQDEHPCIVGNPDVRHELDAAAEGLGGFPLANTALHRRPNRNPTPLQPPPTATSITTSNGLSFPAPTAVSVLKHLSERATLDGAALELDLCTASSPERQSAATAAVEVADDYPYGQARSGRPLHFTSVLELRPPQPAVATPPHYPLSASLSVPGRGAPDSTASKHHSAGLPPKQLQRGRFAAQSLPTAPPPHPLLRGPPKSSDSSPGRAPLPTPPHTYPLLPIAPGHQLWPPQLSGHPSAVALPPHNHSQQQHQQQGTAWRLWPPLRGSARIGAPQRPQQERQQPGSEGTEDYSVHELMGAPQGLPQPSSQRQRLLSSMLQHAPPQGRGPVMEPSDSTVGGPGRGRWLAGRKRRASELESEDGAAVTAASDALGRPRA